MDTVSVSSHSYSTDNLKRILFPILQSAQKSLLSLLFMISQRDDLGTISDLTVIDKRFPLDELNRVGKPADENKDAGDSEDEDGDDDDDCDDDQDADDSSEEEGSDDDDEEDSDGEANGNGGDSDDDDDDDDGEDDDDNEDEDDDEEEDEEEETQPPS